MKEILKKRSNSFAHGCVKLAIDLPKSKVGSHIELQLVRCSTSVAGNYHAACLGQSKRAFISKLGIVIKEADECMFWLEFLRDKGLAKSESFPNLLQEAKELTSIFIASRITAIKNLK